MRALLALLLAAALLACGRYGPPERTSPTTKSAAPAARTGAAPAAVGPDEEGACQNCPVPEGEAERGTEPE